MIMTRKSSFLAAIVLLLLACERVDTTAAGASLRGARDEVHSSTTHDSTGNSDNAGPSDAQKEKVYDALGSALDRHNKASPEDYQEVKAALRKEYLDEWHRNHDAEHLPKKLQGSNVSSSAQGKVQTLYTIGAAGSGSPGLRSVSGSCFSGLRVYSKQMMSNGLRHDPVAWVGNGDWLYHPRMAAASLANDDGSLDDAHVCSDAQMRLPPWEYSTPWLFDLHSTDKTYNTAIAKSELDQLTRFRDSSAALADISYEQNDPNHAQELASGIGHNVIGAAKFEGSWSEGLQVAYLLQDTKSLGCVLTFQGTYSNQDAWTDAAAYAVPFCGLTQRGENCCTLTPTCTGICKPKNPNDSFVHMGFRNQLRRMVGTKAFQQNIRARLPFCKDVKTFGHSLGGAMSELFTACVERSLGERDYGYDDYVKMAWTKDSAKQMSIDASFD